MRHFVFSCDAHIVEPPDLFTANMPDHLKQWAPNAIVDEKNVRHFRIGDTLAFKMPINFAGQKNGYDDDLDIKRFGARDLKLRLADMDRDGVDAELVFPTLGLLHSRITDAEASRVGARIYNDWAWDFLDGIRSKLIPAAVMPLVNMEDALAELKRVIAKGYKAIMMPAVNLPGMPEYNDPAWDPFLAICGEAGVPLVVHTGVGNVGLRVGRGPGSAVFNYTRQMNDGVDAITQLVASGRLDNNPKTHVLFVEMGAGWLMGLAERLDEVYYGHATHVQPKLQRKPSEIVRDQIHCSFQNDPGCLLTRKRLSVENFLFATDYPHSEGTFPYSRKIVDEMFDMVPDMTEEERAAVLGMNAAKMFKISPEQVAAETRRALEAA